MVYAEENLAIRQKIGDLDGEAFAFYMMAEAEYLQGNSCRAIELWEASQRGFKVIENNEFALLFSSLPTRIAITQGDYNRAFELSEALLAAGKEISSSLVIAEALGNLCWSAWALKEYDQIARLCEEALGPDWENNLPCGRGTLLYVFGRVVLSQGKYAQVCSYLKHFGTIGVVEKFLSIQALGILVATRKQDRRAAVLFGALDQRCSWLKNVSSPSERAEYEQALTSVRTALGEAAFATAWAEGHALTTEQVMEMARTIAEEPNA